MINGPRRERLQNCGQIFIEQYQQQRKNEFFDSYNEYIENFGEIQEEDNNRPTQNQYEHDTEDRNDGRDRNAGENTVTNQKNEFDRHAFSSNLNQYLDSENQEKNEHEENKSNNHEEIYSVGRNEDYMEYLESEEDEQEEYDHEPNVSARKVMTSDIDSKLSFNNSNEKVDLNDDIIKESPENKTDGLSPPSKEAKIYRYSPGSTSKRSKGLPDNNMIKVEYPSFGDENLSKQNTVEMGPPINDPEPNEAVNSELDTYMQFLISKYDQASNKDEVENLIMEIHKIKNQNVSQIPEEFKEKLNVFVQKQIKSLKESTPTPKKQKFHQNTSSSKEETKRPMTSSMKKTQSPEKFVDSRIVQTPRETNSELRTYSGFMDEVQNNPDLLAEYRELVNEYEETRQEIKAKQLMKFKTMRNMSKIEHNIAIALMYYFYQIDNSIRLKTDKRQLESKSWENISKYFSNAGKLIMNMKKILPFLEDMKISDAHFVEIKRYMETLSPTQVESLHRINGVTGLIYNYVMAAFNITKFLRSIYKANEEPKIKKMPYKPPRPAPETRIMNEEDMNLIVASKQNRFKVKLHSDMYNDNLAIGFGNMKKEADIKDTESRIKALRKLKSDLQWKEKRDNKFHKEKMKKRDEEEYMQYQEELRRMAIGIIQKQIQEDKKLKLDKNYNIIQDEKVEKMKHELQSKMQQIDEFKKNIEISEWNQMQEQEKHEEKKMMHKEFVRKLQEEKVFKQLVYAAEQKLEHEERKRKRENALKFKHQKLVNEQEELEEELYMLQQMYS